MLQFEYILIFEGVVRQYYPLWLQMEIYHEKETD